MSVIITIFVILAIAASIFYRRRPNVHIPLIMCALTIDMLFVIFIEMNRSEVESIVGKPLSPVVMVHIIVSTFVILIYFFMLFFGCRLLSVDKGRTQHVVGISLYAGFRLLSFVTSYFIQPIGQIV